MSNHTEEELFFDVQQKTDKQHILDNPDTYIGSVELVDSQQWVLDMESGARIVEKQMQYVPGLYKMFDEAIVNCRDHAVRMRTRMEENKETALPVSYIDVSVNREDGTITMTNDGNGIDVAQKDGFWVPEMVFAQLRTSTNYNKDEKKIVGGKNGLGFKCVLIWSTYGRIETVDHLRGLKYVQEYHQNLDVVVPPVITKAKCKPYTKITFRPDYARFQLAGLSEDMVALFYRRVHDIAAVTDKTVKVRLNDALLPIKTFAQYIDLYIGDKAQTARVHEEANDRWEYAVALTPNAEFAHVSFVNGIHTPKGGKHVEYVLNQLTRKLVEYIEKRRKVKVNANAIKEQLILFLRCDIENPAFDSQTKDYMNTPATKFGSKCEVSDKFVEKVAKMGVMDAACAINEVKETKAAKKTDGTKSKSVRGIPKLTDANWAGTEKSRHCMLILCEGDSAKSGILSGLSPADRDVVGVYPLRGKLLNVRGEAAKKIAENKEIAEIKQILGLASGQQYNTIEDVHRLLRYSRVVFMTDQDLDGSHIKGLGINAFECEWRSLLAIPGFLGFMNTPILKAKPKGASSAQPALNFYNNGEYEAWKAEQTAAGSLHQWNIKYYKGLGTSTAKEFREYFQEKRVVTFQHAGASSSDAIDLVFNKKRAEDRKAWLQQYDRRAFLNTSLPEVTYDDFVHREFIHFSKYDCDRSIPSLVDGLKISQRKILFGAFKRNLTQEVKVAQFSGYVSEHSGYHHGEASLNATIVKMAQTFVGSNNINLFVPNGQFGTRLQGGKDSASERYIFTQLSKITRTLFPAADDGVLEYLEDDGQPVEPLFYAPILPMILVNGSEGIGTGFSTEILCYHPLQIAQYLETKLRSELPSGELFVPYYEGFRGSITPLGEDGRKFLIRGVYELVPKEGPDVVRITELPVGYWTEQLIELIEHWTNPGEDKDKNKIAPLIKDHNDNSSDTKVDVTIYFVKGKLAELLAAPGDFGCNGLEKLLKLYTTCSTSNMHLFDADDVLQKFDTVSQIIDAYFPVRLSIYEKRRLLQLQQVGLEVRYLENKANYIRATLDGRIDLRKKSPEQVHGLLASHRLEIIDAAEGYEYLLKMRMDAVTEDNVVRLMEKVEAKRGELHELQQLQPSTMWLKELELFRRAYTQWRAEREEQQQQQDPNAANPANAKSTKRHKAEKEGSGSSSSQPRKKANIKVM